MCDGVAAAAWPVLSLYACIYAAAYCPWLCCLRPRDEGDALGLV
jgi:hypothetical protein